MSKFSFRLDVHRRFGFLFDSVEAHPEWTRCVQTKESKRGDRTKNDRVAQLVEHCPG